MLWYIFDAVRNSDAGGVTIALALCCEIRGRQQLLIVRIQVFDWGIREGINKLQEWADRASRKKSIARIP